MRRHIAILVSLVLSSCSSPTPEPPRAPVQPLPEVSALPESGELAGHKIEREAEGAWIVRRVAGRPAAEVDCAPGAALGGRRSRSLGAIGGPGGAPPPTALAEGGEAGGAGAMPPSDAESRAPSPALSAPEASPPPVPEGPVRELVERADEAARPLDRPRAEAEAAPMSPQTASPLRAGATDDNADYEKYIAFIGEWLEKKDIADRIQWIDVRDRRFIRVVNRDRKPVPGARVLVVDEARDRIVLSGTTYGDGRVPFYPRLEKVEGPVPVSYAAGERLLVEAAFGGARARTEWDGQGDELIVEIDAPKPVAAPIALDVLFLIDTTGSMGDEIRQIKATLLAVTEKLRNLEREFDLRYAAVLYRDLGDDYVTRAHPFTSDLEAFAGALRSVQANGGGDMPESLNQGLAEAVGRADWRDGAAKVMFLIADAPPHMDYAGDVRYGESVKGAVERGIRIHAVAASGIDAVGTFIFRQIAQFARGKFIFIEYGKPGETAKSHGVAGKVEANNLDDIIFEQIRDEVARWGRE
ncbi:MAG: VWA domain-containing protein [Planctomycetes bacterium]|nr:VWA domain-containing protein [Planctomycetota bacterium]